MFRPPRLLLFISHESATTTDQPLPVETNASSHGTLLKVETVLIFWLMRPVQFSCARNDKTTLCGTWRMVKGMYNGPDFEVVTTEENSVCHKILAENHFSVVEMFTHNPDSHFFTAAGTYTLLDSTYMEHYKASNLPGKTGATLIFHSVVKDNKWTITLKDEDLQLTETWACVNARARETNF